jgi:MFS family permease
MSLNNAARCTGSVVQAAGMSLRRSWLIIGVIFVQWLIGYFDKTAMSIIAVPVSKEFGFSPSQMGMVLSAFFLGFAVMTPVGGYLADRYGARRVLMVIIVLWSVFTGLTALAFSLVSLIIIRALFGAAEGSFPAASSVAVAEVVPQRHRGKAKSLLVSGSSLGTAVGAYLIASLAGAWGWRSGFIIFAVLGVLLSVVFWKVSKPMPLPVRTSHQTAGELSLKSLLRHSFIWKLVAMQFGVGIFVWGMGQWMPTYWVQEKGLELTSAGIATAIPNLAAFVAMISVGALVDKWPGFEGKLIAGLMAVAIVFVYLTYIAETVPMGIAFLSVAQVAATSCAPLLSIIVLKRVRRAVTGTATGIGNFGQQFAGVLAPTIMGFAIQATHSFVAVFGIVMAVMAAALVVALTADRSRLGSLSIAEDEAAPSVATEPAGMVTDDENADIAGHAGNTR